MSCHDVTFAEPSGTYDIDICLKLRGNCARANERHGGLCVCVFVQAGTSYRGRTSDVGGSNRPSAAAGACHLSPCQHAASLLGRKADAPPTCMHAGLRTAFRRGQTSRTVISHSKPEEWSRRTHDRVNCAAAANAARHQPTPYSPGWVLRTADIKNLRLVIWRLG